MVNLLLLSNSTVPGTSFLSWPRPYVTEFLGTEVRDLLFIPFAAVTTSFDQYASLAKVVFKEMGYTVSSMHEVNDRLTAVDKTQGLVVGGGNSFALLSRMYEGKLLEAVKNKVLNGTPYIGWSAGANLACPTIMTTNDMPVVYPPSLRALDLIPFQINPHYHELRFEHQGGETRKERLDEFLAMNPEKKVIGLPEGMLLERKHDRLTIRGNGIAKLYQAGKQLTDLQPGDDLSYLLR